MEDYNMGWMEFVLGIATLVLGTGWLFTYRAFKKRNEGEAMQAEAGGWEGQQRVYQNTIADLEKSCEFIRNDRDLLRKENEELRRENKELRDKINHLESVILDIRKDMARQGRRIESLTNKTKKETKQRSKEDK